MNATEGVFARKGALKVMIAGHGGQGVLDLGNYIAYQALKEEKHVVFTPTYGPESRGGKVRCWVTLSDKPIDAPVADVVDILMVLNKPSMDFIPQLRSGGVLLYNVSIIDREVGRDDVTAIGIPGSELASRLAENLPPDDPGAKDPAKALNCVMYGGYLRCSGWRLQSAIEEAEDTFRHFYRGKKADFIPLNLAGLKKGFECLPSAWRSGPA